MQQPSSVIDITRDQFPLQYVVETRDSLDMPYQSASTITNEYSSKHGLPHWGTQDARAPQPEFYTDTSPTWSQNLFGNVTAHRRGSLDYGDSTGSGSVPSSASSSSFHLPADDFQNQQHFNTNVSSIQVATMFTKSPQQASYDPFGSQHGTQGQASSEDLYAPFHSAFGVLSLHDPDAPPFFSHLEPQHQSQLQQSAPAQATASAAQPNPGGVGAGTDTMGSDPNAMPMSRDNLSWLFSSGTNYSTPTPTGFLPRRRAASMYNGKTPTALPDAFLRADYRSHAYLGLQPRYHQHQQHQQECQEPRIDVSYGGLPGPEVTEDLSSWSAKIQSQRPPELRLAAKAKARRQTVAGGERAQQQPVRVPPVQPVLLRTPRSGDTGGDSSGHRASCYLRQGSASPVDPHSRSSSVSTASWGSSDSEAQRRPSFKRLPSTTPLEQDRDRKRMLVTSASGSVVSVGAGPVIGVDGGTSNTGNGEIARGGTPMSAVVDSGIRRVVNLAQRRRRASAGASGVGDSPFILGLGPGFGI
ncbi:hypothetical protein C0991_007767 [Blastosporella zonata]|nr:hypothetical protein C0991_007767 [Blastosporella zonata]